MLVGPFYHREWFDSDSREWARSQLSKLKRRHKTLQLVGVGFSGAARVIDLAEGGRRFPYLLLRASREWDKGNGHPNFMGKFESSNLVFIDDLIDTGRTLKHTDQKLVRSGKVLCMTRDIKEHISQPLLNREWVGGLLTTSQRVLSPQEILYILGRRW